jgi:hypothetical protein
MRSKVEEAAVAWKRVVAEGASVVADEVQRSPPLDKARGYALS